MRKLMYQRGQITTFQQRLEIAEQAKTGQNDAQIAQAMGCSVYTVRKWRRRENKLGRLGLSSKMGRPVRGPLSTLPPQVAQTILQLRKQHPGWGPITLLVELRHDPALAEQPLPSRARVVALLKYAGLTRRYQPHQELPPPASPTLENPHQEWQMDAQRTNKVAGEGKGSLR